MANEIRKITLTQYNNLSGPAYSVEYSTDCITYSQSMDCTNLFLPSVGSFGFCTVDDQTTCIRLTSITAPCTNSVVEDLRPTTTTTTTTTTAAPTTTTTSTTTTTTSTTSTTTSTTTTTAAPTTTTTTVAGQKLFVIESTNNTAFPFNSASHDIVLNRFLATSFTKDGYEPGFSAVSASRVITGTSELNTFIGWSGFPAGTLEITQSLFGDATLIVTNAQVVNTNLVTGLSLSPGNINYDSYNTIKSVNFINPTGSTTTTTTTTTAAPTTTTTSTTTSTTTTTTTAAPITASCYTLETVQSSQGECFDCPGFFASTTDTVMKIFTECSGSEIFPPFDIFVESRYSDNSTSSLFIPAGYTSSIIIATSDVQCVAPPTCGEIASPTFVSASITSPSGSITECCVTPPTTTTTTAGPTTTTTTSTTTTTTTTTAAPISSTYYDVVIDQTDLDDATGNTDPGKNDGTVYVDYTNSSGNPATAQYSLAGTFTNSICVETLSTPTIYYYKNNTSTAPMGSSVSDTSTSC